jgi:hypothetical protein
MHEPLPMRTAGVVDAPIQRDLGVHVLHRDYETRSTLLLKCVGAHKYAADSNTDVLCCAFAADDQPVRLWIPADPVPPEFVQAANDPNWIVAAHGDHFETAIEHQIMAPRFDWPEIPLERHCCTMTMAAALALPARLSNVADALELADRKDGAGERLMYQMSKPRQARLGEDPNQTHWFDDDERLRGFTSIAGKMLKSSGHYFIGCRCCPRLSTCCGS